MKKSISDIGLIVISICIAIVIGALILDQMKTAIYEDSNNFKNMICENQSGEVYFQYARGFNSKLNNESGVKFISYDQKGYSNGYYNFSCTVNAIS